MKQIIMVSMVLALSGFAYANHEPGHDGTESKKAEAQEVNMACSEEAKTAQCGDEKVGTGLLKCLHAYKKAHKKDFKFSEGCKSAMKSLKKAKK